MTLSQQPPQKQTQQPGIESQMNPRPQTDDPDYYGSNKLTNKIALITGGDSGIGEAVAIAFAKEGANIAIIYLNEHEDAKRVKGIVESYGSRCELYPGDITDESFCRSAVAQVVEELGGINILVNNAAEQHPKETIEDIDAEQLERTFRTNIFSMFYLVKAALTHMQEGDSIINSTSVTAYRGSRHLMDYAATKGAIVAFTRSLAQNLMEQGIRVNAVAPGPIWTPLIPASFSEEQVAEFGEQTPMKRAAQPCEIAPSYVFLAAKDASYMSGQVLHPNGGEIVAG